MRKAFPLIALIAVNGLAQNTTPAAPARKFVPPPTIQAYDGGSVVTDLPYDIQVNKGSSLHRRWYVINDPSCPVDLAMVGVKPRYAGNAGYKFEPVGDLIAKVPISAVQVIFAQFNVWGNPERNLGATEIRDLQSGQTFKIEANWYATENDVSEQLTSVAYVRNAMTSDGKIWRADLDKIAALLQTVALKISASGLESEPRKEPEKN